MYGLRVKEVRQISFTWFGTTKAVSSKWYERCPNPPTYYCCLCFCRSHTRM